MTLSISSVFPASQIARMAKRPAAGAAKIAMYCVIPVRYGAKPVHVPKVQGDSAPIPTKVRAAIKKVGTLSCVIDPMAKNDKIPTTKPKIPKRAATYEFVSVYHSAPTIRPTITASKIPIRNSQLPRVLNIFAILTPPYFSSIFILYLMANNNMVIFKICDLFNVYIR